MIHTPDKDCQLSSTNPTPSPKPLHNNPQNNKQSQKQVIGLSTSLKHNSFDIICHTAELGFLLTFIQKKVGH
jgi:hypothetical protein